MKFYPKLKFPPLYYTGAREKFKGMEGKQCERGTQIDLKTEFIITTCS